MLSSSLRLPFFSRNNSTSSGGMISRFLSSDKEDEDDSYTIVDPHIHELRTTTIQTASLGEYVSFTKENIPIKVEQGAKIIGFFTTVFGKRNQVVQIWEWKDFKQRAMINQRLKTNNVWMAYTRKVKPLFTEQISAIIHQYDFWPLRAPTTAGGTYELRTYHLKAGSVPVWQSYWQQGLKYRSQYVHPVGAWYAETGTELDTVYHLWHYSDLDKRRELRYKPWKHPGWGDVVQATVPMIRRSESAILAPVDFSPLQ